MSQPTKPSHTGIVVLGMHRSGTSLASHLLIALGCHPGGSLMPPKDDNPLGYWEHAGVVEVHDDFLLATGRMWEDPMPWSREDFLSPAADRARRRLEEIFHRDFEARALWVLKDPRLCRLLPLWSEIWDRSCHEIRFLHVLRSPWAVARSLGRRNGFTPAASYLLWLRHVLESESFTRHRPRAWVELEALATSPFEVMEDVLGRLGADGFLDLAAARPAVAGVAQASAVHHRAGKAEEEELRRAFPWVARTAQALGGLRRREDESLHRELDAVAAEIAAVEREPLYAGTVPLLAAAARGHIVLAQELKGVSTEAEQYARKLTDQIDRLTGLQREVREYVEKLEKEIAAKDAELARAADYARRMEGTIAETTMQVAASPSEETEDRIPENG